MRSPEPARSWGFLDNPVAWNDGLTFIGWLIPPGDRPRASDWRVAVGSRELSPVHVESELPSEDVRKAWPNLVGADRSRFAIRVPCDREAVADRLITIVPRLTASEGNRLFALADPSTPLPDKRFADAVGEGFLSVSLEFLGYLVDKAGLDPSHRILDAGCGLGRMAYGLSYYLEASGDYEGFDVSEDLVSWAATTIGSRRDNFRFQRVDVVNGAYNPRGRIRAEDFVFPYPDDHFDVVLLASIFTHLRPIDVRAYLGQISRVLRPGGRCLATCFLTTEEARRCIASGQSTIDFRHPIENYHTSNPKRPEDAIAHDPVLFEQWAAEAGLFVRDEYPGLWCGRPSPGSYQDMLILEKPSTTAP